MNLNIFCSTMAPTSTTAAWWIDEESRPCPKHKLILYINQFIIEPLFFRCTYSEKRNLVVFCSRRQTETACRGHPVIRSSGKLAVFKQSLPSEKKESFLIQKRA